jgi:hypothetical protein
LLQLPQWLTFFRKGVLNESQDWKAGPLAFSEKELTKKTEK